jgi:hypothetical protein
MSADDVIFSPRMLKFVESNFCVKEQQLPPAIIDSVEIGANGGWSTQLGALTACRVYVHCLLGALEAEEKES